MPNKVILIGESCNDIYYYGHVNRISPEAPVPIFDFVSESVAHQGMAANVAENLLNLNVDVELYTETLESKTRFIDIKTDMQLMRVDEKIGKGKFNIDSVKNWEADAVVISDYDKGYIAYSDINEIRTRYDGPVFIDTKKKDIGQFNNMTIKVNNKEWNEKISEPNDTCDCIVTLGSLGVMYKDKKYGAPKISVADTCGAGDTFISAYVVEFIKSGNAVKAIEFAMKAAAITVQHLGVYAPRLEEIYAT